MFKQKNSVLFLALAAVFVAFIVFSPLIVDKIFAQTPTSGPLSGWAWSSNIGWICFGNPNNNCPGATVILNSNGILSGQAWSSNIGWISFDNLGTGPDGQPSARLFGGSSIVGWARACSVFASGCSGALKSDSYRGGWDGWLKFGGGTMTSGWTGVSLVGSQLEGFAWGDLILGWVKFDGVTGGGSGCTGVCVSGAFSASCLVTPPSSNVGDVLTFSIQTVNGSPVYTYNVIIRNTDTGVPIYGSESQEHQSLDTGQVVNYSFTSAEISNTPFPAGNYRFEADIYDGNANNGDTNCNANFTINNGNQSGPKLTVNVIGSGKVSSVPSGITDCSTSCNANFPSNSSVTLTATPLTNGEFKTWSGCTPDTTNPLKCTINMGTSDKTVVATFDEIQKFTLSSSYPNGRNMVVNYQTQDLDSPHDSTSATIHISDFDNDPSNNNFTIRFELIMSPLTNRTAAGHPIPVMQPTITAAQIGSNQDIHIHFGDDSQGLANKASPFAGNYQFVLKATPSDGSKVVTLPINFSYIDLREREQ